MRLNISQVSARSNRVELRNIDQQDVNSGDRTTPPREQNGKNQQERWLTTLLTWLGRSLGCLSI